MLLKKEQIKEQSKTLFLYKNIPKKNHRNHVLQSKSLSQKLRSPKKHDYNQMFQIINLLLVLLLKVCIVLLRKSRKNMKSTVFHMIKAPKQLISNCILQNLLPLGWYNEFQNPCIYSHVFDYLASHVLPLQSSCNKKYLKKGKIVKQLGVF